MSDKCKYCGAALEDGFCSRPCAKGASERRVSEDRDAVKAEKEIAAAENGAGD